MLRRILGTLSVVAVCLAVAACENEEAANGTATNPTDPQGNEVAPAGTDAMDIGDSGSGTGTEGQ